MSEKQFNKDNAFSNEAHLQFSEIPEVAGEMTDDMSTEEVAIALAFSSLLSDILTDEQKDKLSNWERAALEHLSELADEVGLEYIGTDLRS